MSVLSYPFHSLLLKLPNKEMDFPFPPLKLSNKGMKEYSKMILFIPFPPPKRGLNVNGRKNILIKKFIFKYPMSCQMATFPPIRKGWG